MPRTRKEVGVIQGACVTGEEFVVVLMTRGKPYTYRVRYVVGRGGEPHGGSTYRGFWEGVLGRKLRPREHPAPEQCRNLAVRFTIRSYPNHPEYPDVLTDWEPCPDGSTMTEIPDTEQTRPSARPFGITVDELRALPYPDYLQTTHWQAQRAAALERAGHRCQVCNGAEHLDTHHRTYERLGRELPSDLTVLCRACHARFHDKMPAGAR